MNVRANVAFGGHGNADALLAACDAIASMNGGHEMIAELAK